MGNLCFEAHKLQNGLQITCEEKPIFENAGFREFSHTFSSASQHINETNAKAALFACLLIDFIIPFVLFFLLKAPRPIEPLPPTEPRTLLLSR